MCSHHHLPVNGNNLRRCSQSAERVKRHRVQRLGLLRRVGEKNHLAARERPQSMEIEVSQSLKVAMLKPYSLLTPVRV